LAAQVTGPETGQSQVLVETALYSYIQQTTE
jgi:hypothetical protein